MLINLLSIICSIYSFCFNIQYNMVYQHNFSKITNFYYIAQEIFLLRIWKRFICTTTLIAHRENIHNNNKPTTTQSSFRVTNREGEIIFCENEWISWRVEEPCYSCGCSCGSSCQSSNNRKECGYQNSVSFINFLFIFLLYLKYS